MRSFLKKTHFWLAIPAGIIIVILSLTGAILVFQEEFLRLTYPERYCVSDTSLSALPLSEIIEKVNLQLKDDKVVAIQITDDPEATYVATLESGARSHAYIDPYSAEIKGQYNYRSGFFFQVMRIHRWMMFKDFSTGRLITGGATILFVIILISGVVVWFPRKGLPRKQHFTIKWKGKFIRRLLDMHRVAGFYASIVLLVLCLTGLMWSFEWYRNGVGALFGVEKQTETEGDGKGERGKGSERREESKEETIDWNKALEVTRNGLSDYKYFSISKDNSVTVLQNKAPHPRASDTYKIEGEKLQTISKYNEKNDIRHLMTWAYALHVGNWGGIWSKILVFIASLIGVTLPITGYWLWLRKLRLKNNNRK